MEDEFLIWVSLSYAIAGIIVRGVVVVEAAPVFQWMYGKGWTSIVWPWIQRKGGVVVVLSPSLLETREMKP